MANSLQNSTPSCNVMINLHDDSEFLTENDSLVSREVESSF